MMPAEERIEFVVKADDFCAGLFEQHIEITAPGSIHQFHRDFEPGLSDGGEINQPAQLFEVGRLRIQSFAGERADHHGREAPVAREELRNVRFNLLGDLRRGRRAVVRGEFQALILSRVVARGHIDPANRLAVANRVSDHRRGRVAIAQQRDEAAGGEHFGGREGEFPAQKTGVVAHNYRRLALEEFGVRSAEFEIEKVRDALGGEANIIESEVPRNQAAPAARSKFDGRHSLVC